MPAVDILLIGDSSNVIVAAEVGSGANTERFDVLDADAPYRGASYLATQDLDGDGYRDLQLLIGWGVTGNNVYMIWRYEPATRRLAPNAALTALGGGSPIGDGRCLLGRGNGGMAGMIYRESIHCWKDGRLIEVEHTEQAYHEAAKVLVRTVWRRRGADTLVIVSVDTTRPPPWW